MDTVCIGYPLPLPVIVSFGPWLSAMIAARPVFRCPFQSVMARNGPVEP